MTIEQRQRDDLDDVIESLNDTELEGLAAADFAIDIAVLLHRARERCGMSQTDLARQLGVTQQAVSRIERPQSNLTVETIRKYLTALGFELEISIREPKSGEVVERLCVPVPDANRRPTPDSLVSTMS